MAKKITKDEYDRSRKNGNAGTRNAQERKDGNGSHWQLVNVPGVGTCRVPTDVKK